MAQTAVECIHCISETVIKFGKNPKDRQRHCCKSCNKTFQKEYANNAAKPETKKIIIKMSLNGRGIRDISRVLEISTDSHFCVKKAGSILANVNPKYQDLQKPLKMRLQTDEMWGRVYSKQAP
ncbi:MAG: IS1-like element transposase [Oscillospiraceae bacterium]|nr:IS1-like element transposase [Oscillospiraceae bacterium]